MSDSISTLLLRNVSDVFGENDPCVMQLTFFKIFDFASDFRFWQLLGLLLLPSGFFNSTALTKHSISLRLRNFVLRTIVEKEIDRSNATVPGDDKIGSRVNRWFAGSARYPSDPSGIT